MKPHFAILGAGAIGSIIGAHLARAGHSVVMIARGRRAEQVQREGLRITGLAEFSVPVQTIADPAQFKGAEVFIVATKTTGTAEALQTLRHAEVDVAFSIQNGVWKDDALVDVFGRERVLGALANTSGELMSSGEVLFTRNVNLYIGELQGGDSERAQRIAHTIDASGVRSTAVPDMLQREWTKFVGWVGLMSMSVATRAYTWNYLSDPDCALLLVSSMKWDGWRRRPASSSPRKRNSYRRGPLLARPKRRASTWCSKQGRSSGETRRSIECRRCRISTPAERSKWRKRSAMPSAVPQSSGSRCPSSKRPIAWSRQSIGRTGVSRDSRFVNRDSCARQRASTFTLQPSAFSPQPSVFSLQPSAFSPSKSA
jgi:2-dehydropantoate 2-reductase